MPEHEVTSQKKQGKADQNRRVSTLNPQPMAQNLMAWDISSYLGETTFNPPIQKHAALLSSASSEQRAVITRRLQQTYGNRYVQRLIKSMTVQAKLTVEAADDQHEHEADHVAEQVMNMSAPIFTNHQVTINQSKAQRQTPKEENEELQTKPLALSITPLVRRQVPPDAEEAQTKPLIQRQTPDEEEEEPVQAKSLVQRQSSQEDDELQTKPNLQREAPQKEEEELQTKPLLQRQTSQEEDEIQTARIPLEQTQDPRGSFDAGSSVEQRLQTQSGSGSPLSGEMRSFMEPRFGADFSGVRVHSDSEAAQLNRELSARAFTHGQDIYLGEGKKDLGTTEGKRLLAHELTHVVQQNGKSAKSPVPLSLSKAEDNTLTPQETTSIRSKKNDDAVLQSDLNSKEENGKREEFAAEPKQEAWLTESDLEKTAATKGLGGKIETGESLEEIGENQISGTKPENKTNVGLQVKTESQVDTEGSALNDEVAASFSPASIENTKDSGIGVGETARSKSEVGEEAGNKLIEPEEEKAATSDAEKTPEESTGSGTEAKNATDDATATEESGEPQSGTLMEVAAENSLENQADEVGEKVSEGEKVSVSPTATAPEIQLWSLRGALSSAWGSVKNFAQENIAAPVKKLATSAYQGIKEASAAVGEKVKSWVSSAQNLAARAMDGIKTTAGKVWAGAKKVGAWVEMAGEKVWKGIKAVGKFIGGFVVGFGKGLWEAVKGIGVLLWGLFKLTSPQYALLFPEEREQTWQNLKNALSALTTREGWSRLWEGIKEPYVTAWKTGNYGEAFGRGAFEVVSLLVGPKGATKLAKVGAVTGGKAAAIAGRGAGAFGAMLQGRLGRFGAVASEGLVGVEGRLGNISTKLTTIGKGATLIEGGAKAGLTRLATGLKSAPTKLYNRFSGLVSSAKNRFGGLLKGAWGGVSTGTGAIVNRAGNLLSRLPGVLRNIIPGLRDIVDGLWARIKGTPPEVSVNTERVATAAAAAEKQAGSVIANQVTRSQSLLEGIKGRLLNVTSGMRSGIAGLSGKFQGLLSSFARIGNGVRTQVSVWINKIGDAVAQTRLAKRFKTVEPQEFTKTAKSELVAARPVSISKLRKELPEGWMKSLRNIADEGLRAELEGMRRTILEYLEKRFGAIRTGSKRALSDFDVSFNTFKDIRAAERWLARTYNLSMAEAEGLLGARFFTTAERLATYEKLSALQNLAVRTRILREAEKFLRKGESAVINRELSQIAQKGLDVVRNESDVLFVQFNKTPTMALATEIYFKQMAINIVEGEGAYLASSAKIWAGIRDGLIKSNTTFKEGFVAFLEEQKRIFPSLKQKVKEVIGTGEQAIISDKFRELCKHFERNLDLASKWGTKVDRNFIARALRFAQNDAERLRFVSNPANVEKFINEMGAALEKAGADMEKVNSVLVDMSGRLARIGTVTSLLVKKPSETTQSTAGSEI